MINAFLTHVAPIAAVGFLGWGLGRVQLFTPDDARSINRFVFYVALPVLMFKMLAEAPLEQLNASLAVGYFTAEIIIYGVGFAVARWLFHCELRESILLGMATAFVNHVFFVLPLALNVYGSAATAPILTIVALDNIFIFVGTMLLIDGLSASNTTSLAVLSRTLRNPQLLGILFGIAANLAGLTQPEGLKIFTAFVSAAASPTSLFALGVILSTHMTGEKTGVVLSLSGLKLIVHPFITWVILSVILAFPPEVTAPPLLVAAGPSGALAFVLALHYDVPVGAIARTILITTLGSLAGLSFLI